jgi:hypothetical protein
MLPLLKKNESRSLIEDSLVGFRRYRMSIHRKARSYRFEPFIFTLAGKK